MMFEKGVVIVVEIVETNDLVPGIERDLAGAPMPAGPVFPGPFQALAKGRTEIILPMAGARP